MELLINRNIITDNAKTVMRICQSAGVQLRATIKSAYSSPEVLQALQSAGIEHFCVTQLPDCAPASTIRRQHLHWLRLLSPGVGFEPVIENCRTSLHSEHATIKCASEYAARKKLPHEYVVSVDIGDHRDGVAPSEFAAFFQKSSEYHHRHFQCAGFSVNHTCCGSAPPAGEHFDKISRMLERHRNCGYEPFAHQSAGGSVVLGYFLNGGRLAPYTEVRVGEALLTGDIPFYPTRIAGRRRPFNIRSTVIETKDRKIDGRLRRRALLDFGAIHSDLSQTYPSEPSFKIVGYSGEYTIVEFTEGRFLKVGDELHFELGYQAMARAMSCSLVKKIFL